MQRACPDCERIHAKGKCHAADEEEALLGDAELSEEREQTEPSEQTPSTQFRDLAEGSEGA